MVQNGLLIEEKEFFKENFIETEDMFSYCKNYKIALEQYFNFYLLVYESANDIADGLCVPPIPVSYQLDRMLLFYSFCVKYKELIGSNDDIINPSNNIIIGKITFSLTNLPEDQAKRQIKQAADTMIRTFSSNLNFIEYESALLTLAILDKYI
jgi:hypothetical protein